MTDFLLTLLVLGAFVVAWIEWIPKRYGVFLTLSISFSLIAAGIRWLPAWHGWVVLLIGIADLVWIYFSPRRRKEWPNLFSAPFGLLRDSAIAVKSALGSGIRRMRERKATRQADFPREKTNFLTMDRLRKAVGAFFAVMLSPLAAIPSALVFSALLFTWYALFEDGLQADVDLLVALKQAIGIGFMAIYATLDLFFRHGWLSGPLLLAVGYTIAAYSIGSGVFWHRYSRGLLLFGAIYPVVYIAADVFDWFDHPFFN